MVGILGANSVSGGYEIDNSLRFNDDDSVELNKTLGAPTNNKIYTFSMWLKRSNLGVNSSFIGHYDGSVSNPFVVVQFRSANDALRISAFDNETTGVMDLRTTQLFRDPSAWYHIVLAFDTTQGTSSNRVKVYVNGSQVTSFSTETYPDQNKVLAFNKENTEAYYGIYKYANSNEYDGYMSELYFIDGQQKAASDFGETNDNGVWIPKAYDGTFGDNGHFFEFKQTGTGTDASGMGADTSGNTNHFAPVNLAAIDVTTDTPTNNFATINPLANQFNPAALTEGNTRVDFDNGTSTVYNISTIGVASGKWYCEVKAVDVPSYGEIGIASRPCIAAGNNDKLTFNEFNYGYTANNGNVKSNNTGGSSYGDSFTDGDMIGIALDLDNNKLYFSKNGTFQNSGDPTTGATGTGAVSIQAPSGTIDGVYYFAGGDNKNSDTTRMDFNFGNPAFALDSGNADANGYGDFEYAPPSGYYSLCTKNLAEFG